jgi:hypothetical protein
MKMEGGAPLPAFLLFESARGYILLPGISELIKFAIISVTHMNPSLSIRDSFAEVEWDSLAHTMKALRTGVDAKDARSRRLRTKAGLVRMILYHKLRDFNGDNSIDLAFFIASVKTIRTMERDFDSHRIKRGEFLIFLQLLLQKFERQKLTVKKPLAMLAEFGRMKGVVENGYNPL